MDDGQIEVVDDAMADVLRRMTGAERLAIAWRMWSSARAMLMAHLRNQHPDWSAEQIQRETARRMSHGLVDVPMHRGDFIDGQD